MSCDLSEFEGCFFTDPFSPLSDSIDILKAFQEDSCNLDPISSTLTNENLDTPFDENDQIAPTTTTTTTTTTTVLSSSPPSHLLENLSLYQMISSVNSVGLEVKTEESQLPFHDYCINSSSFLPHSYGGCDNAVKMMQRSFGTRSLDGRQSGFILQPKFNRLIGSSNLHSQVLTSPDHGFSVSNMRRVCSTGDLQSLKSIQTISSSPLATEGSFMEEANCKVGRYSPEERKERILRYKAKRTQRNFNKTIKYACRKTLADNRPRIRGRFARNDEHEETPKASTFHQYEDEDELWMEGLLEEDVEGTSRRQILNTNMPPTLFHQFSYFPK